MRRAAAVLGLESQGMGETAAVMGDGSLVG